MNLTISDIIDLQTLVESVEVEFKLAAGKDGKGKLPKDFWPTYSAMANGRGGWVILGIKELERDFIPVGILDIEKVKTELFNELNNRNKVSVNVISDDDVQEVKLQGKNVLAIQIRPATRKQKPVYLNKSPFGGNTYQRLHEGDRRCDDEVVKIMLAEQVHDIRDNEVLSEHYSFIDDINLDSLKAYRNLFTAHKADHAWLEKDLFEFFKSIGGWRKDRDTGKTGVTLAGILMFGTWDAITATRPNYFVDYQERPEAKTEQRWVDRVYYDGTWSGNLFDFYRKVYQKLTADLKVPFNIEDGQRKSDTPIHIALREALINCIVHADFSERVPILIVKRPDLFGFRNPGLMRIPLEDVIAGGTSGLSVSDCRNQTLQSMFLLIGLSERAGSGIPKIFSGWSAVNWRTPKLQEKLEPAQTILELNTASLIPEETKEQLHKIFGDSFYQLNELETNIVVTAAIENWINHERACELTSEHARDVTLALPRLVQKGFLTPVGESKHKFYTLPGINVATPDQVFANSLPSIVSNITHSDPIITHNDPIITHSDPIITHNDNRDEHGRLESEYLVKPIIDDLDKLDYVLRSKLEEIAKPTIGKTRLSKEQMIQIIIKLCTDQYIEIAQLAILLNRTNQNIRQNYLKPLVENKTLSLAFPQTPTTKRQAYTLANY